MLFRFLIPSLFLFASTGGATTAPAPGQTTLKLEATRSIPETRKALAVVEQEIASLDHEIRVIRTQALTAKAQPGSNGSVLVATLEAQGRSLDLQKSDLQIEQDQLRSELQPTE